LFNLLLAEGFYDVWLAALIISFSSSTILIHNYLKSRKTLIGRTALYYALSSLIWSISISVYTFPTVELVEFDEGFFFLGLAFLAGIIMILAAYDRAKIQSILTPSGKEMHESRFLSALSFLVLAITFAGILRPVINSPFLNSAMGSTSILTDVGLILTSGSLIALARPNFPKKFIYLLAGIVFIIGFVILFGFFAVSYLSPLDAFLPGGGTWLEAAKGLLVASLGVALVMQRGLKAWFAKIILAVSVLFIAILDLVAQYYLNHPVFLSNSVALCFIFIGTVQLWSALKVR